MRNRRKSNQSMPEILSEYEKEFKDNKIKRNMKNTILDTICDEVYNPGTMLDIYLNYIIAGIMIKYYEDEYDYIDFSYIGKMIASILVIKYDKRMSNELTQNAINKAYYDYYSQYGDIKEEMSVDHILDIDYLINTFRNIDVEDENFRSIINDSFWDMLSDFNPEVELSDYNPLKELASKYKHEFHYGYIKRYMHNDIINALSLYYNKYKIYKQYYHIAFDRMNKAVKDNDELNIICYTILVNSLWYGTDNRENDWNIFKSLIEKYDYLRYMII